MRQRAALIFLLVALSLAGCDAEALLVDPTVPTVERDSIRVGGSIREFDLHVPTGEAPGGGWPLVVVLHGLGSDAAEMRALSGFDAVADEERFIAVYPEGLERAWLDAGLGSVVGAGDIATRNVEFVDALIGQLDEDHGLDRDRVYATGLSNGGMFAFHLACNLSTKIAAIGLVAAASISQSFDSCTPERPVSYIAIHGTGDSIVPFGGGMVVPGFEMLGRFQSAEEAAMFWADENGCQSTPESTDLDDVTSTDHSTVTLDAYPGCDGGTGVRLYMVDGGGHTWPGHPPAARQLGVTNMDIDATQLIWEFFEDHPRTGR